LECASATALLRQLLSWCRRLPFGSEYLLRKRRPFGHCRKVKILPAVHLRVYLLFCFRRVRDNLTSGTLHWHISRTSNCNDLFLSFILDVRISFSTTQWVPSLRFACTRFSTSMDGNQRPSWVVASSSSSSSSVTSCTTSKPCRTRGRPGSK